MAEIQKIFKSGVEWRLVLTVLLFFVVLVMILPRQSEATLDCSMASSCSFPDIALLNMASTTNSHVSIGTSTDYNSNIVCCKNVAGLSAACSGTGVSRAIINLSSTTNAHIESSSIATYPISACLHVATGGYVSSTVQLTDCSGYDVTIGSMTSTTNSHMGQPADYIYKICASAEAPAQALSFSLNTSTIGFGVLSPSHARFATNDAVGSDTEAFYQQLHVSTNAQYGYFVSVKGATLSSGTTTIPAIGAIATDSSSGIGTNQFGLQVAYCGGDGSGSGTVLAPYDSGYAYAADATTTSNIIHNTIGAGVTVDYCMGYLANIAPSLKSGSYSTALTYVVTADY